MSDEQHRLQHRVDVDEDVEIPGPADGETCAVGAVVLDRDAKALQGRPDGL